MINDVAQGGIITAMDRKHKNKCQHVELISQSIKSLKILYIFSAFASETGRSV